MFDGLHPTSPMMMSYAKRIQYALSCNFVIPKTLLQRAALASDA